MVRQVQITVPKDKQEDVMAVLKKKSHVHNLSLFEGAYSSLITFNATPVKTGGIIYKLQEAGVGRKFGVINIIALQTALPKVVDYSRARSRVLLEGGNRLMSTHKLSERLPLEEIHEAIDKENKLNFDYVIMCAVASVIASIGLLTDNVIVLVASMLLSPLMGPLLGLTFGYILQDWSLVRRSIRNEFVGVFVTFIVGVMVAFPAVSFDNNGATAGDGTFPTEEMDHRGNLGGLIAGLAIAIPSGAGVALAVTAGTVNPLVGVAISASVLPPVANSGLALVLGLFLSTADSQRSKDLLRISGVSISLWFINCLAIFAVALMLFRMKNISDYKAMKNQWAELEHAKKHPTSDNITNYLELDEPQSGGTGSNNGDDDDAKRDDADGGDGKDSNKVTKSSSTVHFADEEQVSNNV